MTDAGQDPRTVPVEVDVRNHRHERKVRFVWADGHAANYPYEYLRGHCPCATCQGHFAPTQFIHVPGATIDRVDLIGNYAFGIAWTDGHDTGIYTFRKLRDLCPCRACRPEGLEELRRIGVAQE